MTTKAVRDTTEHNTFSEKVSHFLLANRKLIISVLIAAFAALAVFVVLTVVGEQKTKATLDKTEKAVAEWISLKQGGDAKALQEGEDKVLADLVEIAKAGGNSKASARAHLAMAEVYYSRKDWKNALDQYEIAAKMAGKVYTTGINYYNAAVCADELGNADEAVRLYGLAAEVKDFIFTSRALFNLGRVEEQRGKKVEAIKAYEKLVADYADDEWAKLAKSRIIALSIN
jgi:Tfp pilus assembly protein PilF